MTRCGLAPARDPATTDVPAAQASAAPRPPARALRGDQPPAALAQACCDRWADGTGRPALICPHPDGRVEEVSFDALHATSCRVAQVFAAHGIARRDRVAILLPQGPEAVVALLAAWRIGAIAVPLPRMLDAEALAHRMGHAGVAALVTDDAGLAATASLRLAPAPPRLVLGTEGARPGVLSFWEEAGRAPAGDPAVALRPDDPALILYGGTPLRGVLHAHRALAGQQAAIDHLHGGFPQAGDRVWTPLDWAMRAGLFDALLPALGHGVPVVVAAMPRFDAPRALALMARHGVRNLVLPATALRALRGAGPRAAAGVALRSLVTCGAPADPSLLAWAGAQLGAAPRHAHGVAACNLLLAGAPGALRAVPGHAVAVLDDAGVPLPAGRPGRLAVARAHPGTCLGHWRDAPLRGRWVPTGIAATLDADGTVRLPRDGAAALAEAEEATGPEHVEHCLRRHPAVALAAVVGPVEMAAEPATAIVVPRGDACPGPALAEELRDFMRHCLPGQRIPQRVAFAAALPHAREGGAALGGAVGLGAQRG
jgi:acetyl-CoA synthetase